MLDRRLQPAFLALLALLVVGVVWTAIVVTRLQRDLDPIANSTIARAISGLGSGA